MLSALLALLNLLFGTRKNALYIAYASEIQSELHNRLCLIRLTKTAWESKRRIEFESRHKDFSDRKNYISHIGGESKRRSEWSK